jgi:ribosome maturation factor RimP
MKTTPLERKLIEMTEPVLKDLGFDLVMLEFKGGVLQILAENPASGNLSLDECTVIHKALSPLLEVEDPIPGAYTLEISSPGIDRPLVKAEDYRNYAGFEAKIELDEGVATGQKRFRGVIQKEENGFVTLLVDKEEHRIEIAAIKKARLVLTDDLIKKTRKETKEAV